MPIANPEELFKLVGALLQDDETTSDVMVQLLAYDAQSSESSQNDLFSVLFGGTSRAVIQDDTMRKNLRGVIPKIAEVMTDDAEKISDVAVGCIYFKKVFIDAFHPDSRPAVASEAQARFYVASKLFGCGHTDYSISASYPKDRNGWQVDITEPAVASIIVSPTGKVSVGFCRENMRLFHPQ